MKSVVAFREYPRVAEWRSKYGISPSVARALGRARIPSDIVSAIIT
jgi:hypothetical protein